jgi:hypothetical protein
MNDNSCCKTTAKRPMRIGAGVSDDTSAAGFGPWASRHLWMAIILDFGLRMIEDQVYHLPACVGGSRVPSSWSLAGCWEIALIDNMHNMRCAWMWVIAPMEGSGLGLCLATSIFPT